MKSGIVSLHSEKLTCPVIVRSTLNILPYFSPNSSSLDIGILIDPKIAGLGHGKKIWGCLLEIARTFSEVKLITAGTHEENCAMLKIFVSHGMLERSNGLTGLPNHRYFTLEI